MAEINAFTCRWAARSSDSTVMLKSVFLLVSAMATWRPGRPAACDSVRDRVLRYLALNHNIAARLRELHRPGMAIHKISGHHARGVRTNCGDVRLGDNVLKATIWPFPEIVP